MVQRQWTGYDLFDSVIGQHLAHGGIDSGSILGQIVTAKSANRVDGQPQVTGGIDDA